MRPNAHVQDVYLCKVETTWLVHFAELNGLKLQNELNHQCDSLCISHHEDMLGISHHEDMLECSQVIYNTSTIAATDGAA